MRYPIRLARRPPPRPGQTGSTPGRTIASMRHDPGVARKRSEPVATALPWSSVRAVRVGPDVRKAVEKVDGCEDGPIQPMADVGGRRRSRADLVVGQISRPPSTHASATVDSQPGGPGDREHRALSGH